MSVISRIRPEVEAAKRALREGREALRAQHASGSPGFQVCGRMTDLFDSVVTGLFTLVASETASAGLDSRVALVAHGGLGRRDVAPYSDADLMLLHAPDAGALVVPLARRFSQYVYDSGLPLGFSVRTPSQAHQLSWRDATILTSLTESRFLAGNERLFTRYFETLRRGARRRARQLLPMIEEARRAERAQFGETVYLLCPNIKRSRGGLRDLQLIRWIGFVARGEHDFLALERLGALPPEERRRLAKAHEFLLRLRNELHFHHDKALDVLDRHEQVRLAPLYGFRGRDGVLPVEEFMRLYFEHTSETRYASSNFAAGARGRSAVAGFFGRLFSRAVDGDYLIGPVHIRATRRGLKKLRGNLREVMRLMDLANLTDKRIDHPTWQAIRRDMADRDDVALSPEAVLRFLSILSQPARLGDLLRRLHQLRVLEIFVPPLRHARGLLQFNDYHKYTIDEHCIRSVDRAAEFAHDPGPVGDAYRQIRGKRTLHFALLVHDLGKGHPGDHSEVGKELAAETARLLHMPAAEVEMIAFLVEKHLRLSHVAFRHDLTNESVIVSFAGEIGSLEALRMLYVLTCADVAAVGPGVLTRWKLDLINELYERTREHLSSDYQMPTAKQRVAEMRESLIAKVGESPRREWWIQQIGGLPAGYLIAASLPRILDELGKLVELPSREAMAWGRYLAERQAVEYTVGTHEQIVPGIFHRLTGVLTSTGHSILSAEIHTLADNLVLDRFYAQDLDFAGEPPPERIAEVANRLVASLRNPSDAMPVFRSVWKRETPTAGGLRAMPERVSFDNATSDRHTIITVFAYDRMGLLYAISRAIFEAGLSVHVAKIATYLDQVVDVFYVTDRQGRKIADDAILADIRDRILGALEASRVA
ncbi:MAG: [protein-PII] uridylyltransferase [Planctomycetes bacterium]|nr:[protein-PII] uridylyltransferase [Planctomycetota bacterium]